MNYTFSAVVENEQSIRIVSANNLHVFYKFIFRNKNDLNFFFLIIVELDSIQDQLPPDVISHKLKHSIFQLSPENGKNLILEFCH